jgi:3-oxoacyl-[acyl-carrier protein] reductase
MELGLKGKTALITGASRGIGYGVARLLAAEGCALHIASRTARDLEAARERLTAEHSVGVSVHAFDLAVPANANRLAEASGPIDILVNNAGAIPHGSLDDLADATWREAWDLKVFGFINLTRAVYRDMRARRRGVIINVIGGAGERPNASYIAGSMGNASLMAMSRALGAESPRYGVRVIAVNPGSIETDRQIVRLKSRAKAKFGDENRWRELTTQLPFGRLGSVDELAAVVVFLASERASYMSGTVVTVDGGAASRV